MVFSDKFIYIYFSTGFDLTTHDLYFTIFVEIFTNLISIENSYFTNRTWRTEQKIMVLKLANKNQIIWQCHNFKNNLIKYFQYHPLLYWAKVFVTIIFYFYITESNKWQRRAIWPFNVVTILLTLEPAKYFIILCNTFSWVNFIFPVV